MFKWHVELTSRDEVLLAFLTTCLQEPSCTVVQNNSERYYIVEKEGEPRYLPSDFPSESADNRYYWLSSDFDSYTNPQDVSFYARQQLPLLNSILKLKYSARIRSIKIDDVYRVDEQGRFIKETATFPPVTGGLVTSEQFLQAANAQHPNIVEAWLATRNNPKVFEAMRYYASPFDWFNLYKVYQIIKRDVGKSEHNGSLPRGTFNRWTQNRTRALDFDQSANDFNRSRYNARHSSEDSHYVPGATTMSLHEATQFVTDLLKQWLQTKI
ncbi:MAG TPA: hypothetical protein VK140_06985 [Ktedonobacteraceae bacterium]|nr:hypothetical protein [Ktedonobacteraceae bacterium]